MALRLLSVGIDFCGDIFLPDSGHDYQCHLLLNTHPAVSLLPEIRSIPSLKDKIQRLLDVVKQYAADQGSYMIIDRDRLKLLALFTASPIHLGAHNSKGDNGASKKKCTDRSQQTDLIQVVIHCLPLYTACYAD